MKALILAGGFGTRLRPLSCTRPKLMFPVANKPLLDWTLEQLAESGVDTVVLAVNYMADILKRFFKHERHGIKIIYSRERIPLGTGGPIKKAERFLREDNEPFYVLNGDILSRIDFKDLHRFHKEKGGTITIALREVEDPSRFGVVEVNREDRILSFVEKPKPEESPSNLINAGIYVMEPDIFKLIPRGRKVSTERAVFPVVAEERGLYGYRFDGVWIDTGVPSDYLTANSTMLRLISKDKPVISENAFIHEEAKVIPPAIVGGKVKIGKNASVGPYTSIGDGVEIGEGSVIKASIVLPNTSIEREVKVDTSIVGEAVIMGRRVRVEENCLVGDGVVLQEDVRLMSGVEVCPHKTIRESITSPGIVK